MELWLYDHNKPFLYIPLIANQRLAYLFYIVRYTWPSVIVFAFARAQRLKKQQEETPVLFFAKKFQNESIQRKVTITDII